eukprot:6223898-Alexandrium_andersonii.AAC.1
MGALSSALAVCQWAWLACAALSTVSLGLASASCAPRSRSGISSAAMPPSAPGFLRNASHSAR